MTRRWSFAALPLLLAGVLTGCEPTAEDGPPLATAPEPSAPSLAQVVDDAGHAYTLVEERLPLSLTGLQVSELIGIGGGSLTLAGHTLTVPAGAVTLPTLFVMTPLPGGYVQVDLVALVDTLLGGLLDVGSQGFAQPVTLTLSYARATNVSQPEELLLLHLRGDGTAEPLPSTVDPVRRTVSAELEHFSRYCMAIP